MKRAITLVLSALLVAVLFIQWSDGPALAFDIRSVQGVPVVFPFSNGNLDSTFGAGGTVTVSPGPGNDVPQAVAIQSDGKIITAGFAFNGASDRNNFAVTRLNPNGDLDTSFSAGGVALTPVGTGDAEGFGIALQSDGKILAVGQASNGSNSDIAIVRYNPDGTLDATFDGDGRAMFDVAGANDMARSVAVHPDGRIAIAGNGFVGSNSDIVLVRLDPDGSLDSSFDGNLGNGNGIIATPVGSGHDFGYSVAFQPDGKIVAAGYYSGPASIDSVVLRYNVDGVLDTTFSDDGKAVNAYSPDDVDEALAMALQPDGRIVIAGCIRGNGRLNDYVIARLDANGNRDQTFGDDGFTIVQFSPSPDIALGVAIQADGKIVAAGFANNGTNNDFGVTRVNANGTLDNTFHEDGIQLTMFGPFVDSATAVAVQADGKIVVVGRAVGATADFGIARYGYGTNLAQNDGFIELDAATDVRFENAFQAGATSSMILVPETLPPLDTGWTFADSPRAIQTTAMFSGEIVVRLTLPAEIDASTFAAVRVLQNQNGEWADMTAAAPLRDYSSRTIYASVTSTGVLASAWQRVNVSGRVTTPSGLGLRNAVVSVIDSQGARLTATTSSFGNYTFTGLSAGQIYTISVASKRYRFAARVVNISDSVTDMDFVGLE